MKYEHQKWPEQMSHFQKDGKNPNHLQARVTPG